MCRHHSVLSLTLVPDAVRREAHKGVYARLRGLCGAVLRWSGTVPNARIPERSRVCSAPLKKCCAAPGTSTKQRQKITALAPAGRSTKRVGWGSRNKHERYRRPPTRRLKSAFTRTTLHYDALSGAT